MSEIASFSELQGITTKVDVANPRELANALTALRTHLERLSEVRQADSREIAVARGRVQQSLARVSRASRSGEFEAVAAQCESSFNQCDRACGERECCCCIAYYVDCLLQ